MKRIIILLLSLLLVGCSSNDLKTILDNELSGIENIKYTISPSNKKSLYSYYIQPGIGNKKSLEASNLFEYNNCEFVMNLNVANIVNNKFYSLSTLSNTLDKNLLVYTRSSKFIDSSNKSIEYVFNVYNIDNNYFVYLQSEYFDFYGKISKSEVKEIANIMMIIAKTSIINETKIIAEYSNKESIEYVKESIQLFEVSIPENGRLDEMISDKENIENPLDGDVNTEIKDNIEGNFSDDGDY